MSPLDRVLLKVRQMVSRGVVLLVNDALKMQEMQLKIMADDTMDGVERFQNYGYTSVPHAGSEAIALTVNGDKSHTVVIVVDDGQQAARRANDGFGVVILLFGLFGVRQQVGHADDAGERCPDFMAHVGQEISLGAGCFFGGLAGLTHGV